MRATKSLGPFIITMSNNPPTIRQGTLSNHTPSDLGSDGAFNTSTDSGVLPSKEIVSPV